MAVSRTTGNAGAHWSRCRFPSDVERPPGLGTIPAGDARSRTEGIFCSFFISFVSSWLIFEGDLRMVDTPAPLSEVATAAPVAPIKRRFLFAHWEGGGNTPPMLAIVRRLVARGHEVRALSDLCNQTEVESTGASFASWTRAPMRSDKSAEGDPIK